MQKFPDILKHQVAVLAAEVQTGHVVDVAFNIAIDDLQQVYSGYESLNEAIENINIYLQSRKDMEFVIYNSNQNVIKFISPYPTSSV